jgi:RNA polymerase sigma factor (sigma-70 family)
MDPSESGEPLATGIEREIHDIYAKEAPSMLRYAFAVAGTREAAQDAVQEAFLRFFVVRSAGQEIRCPKAWLFRVLHNHALDQKRAGSRHEIGLDSLRNTPGPGHDPEAHYSRSELLKAKLYPDLSPREIECVRLRAEGLRYEEIAGVLGLQSGTVGALLARAHPQLSVDHQHAKPPRSKMEIGQISNPDRAVTILAPAAVLLIELDGVREGVEEQVEQVREVCEACNAREFRVARTAEERELLWKGRKNAFGAIGRVNPTYYVQDGVVPRTQIAPILRYIQEVAAHYGLKISNIFHAGDGNLHPIIPFNPRRPGDLEKARSAGEDILRRCIALGGSITGEHGVGLEKKELMPELFSAETLDAIRGLKRLFDPEGYFNPGKVLPTGRGCVESRLGVH